MRMRTHAVGWVVAGTALLASVAGCASNPVAHADAPTTGATSASHSTAAPANKARWSTTPSIALPNINSDATNTFGLQRAEQGYRTATQAAVDLSFQPSLLAAAKPTAADFTKLEPSGVSI